MAYPQNKQMVCPYVGIIQIRLWVRAASAHSQPAAASSPVDVGYDNTNFRVLQGEIWNFIAGDGERSSPG